MSDTTATEYVRLLRHVNGLMWQLGNELASAMQDNSRAWAHIGNASANIDSGHVRDLLEQGMLKHAESQAQFDRIREQLCNGMDGVADVVYRAPPKK